MSNFNFDALCESTYNVLMFLLWIRSKLWNSLMTVTLEWWLPFKINACIRDRGRTRPSTGSSLRMFNLMMYALVCESSLWNVKGIRWWKEQLNVHKSKIRWNQWWYIKQMPSLAKSIIWVERIDYDSQTYKLVNDKENNQKKFSWMKPFD